MAHGMVTQDSRVTTQSIYSHRTDRRNEKGGAGARKIGNHLLHQAFYLTDVYTFLVCNHAVLAVRFFTGALGLLRPTLDVGSFISRDSQNIPSLHTTIDEYDQAVTIVRYWGVPTYCCACSRDPASILCYVLSITGSL